MPSSGPESSGGCGATSTQARISASDSAIRWRQNVVRSSAVFSPDSSQCRNFSSTGGSHPPVFVEEAGAHHAAIGDVQDGVIGQLGRLPRVAGGGLIGEREAAVQNDVFFRIQGIRVDEYRHAI